MKTIKSKYNYRTYARIVLEAVTPMSIGSGNKNVATDAYVLLDANQMPYIPGTTLAGLVRHAIGEEIATSFFGNHSKDGGVGSEIMFTEGKLIGEQNQVIDGLQNQLDSEFYHKYKNLPIRQHVRISHRGVNAESGKFDEQIIYKGSRFCFEIELISDKEESDNMSNVLSQLQKQTFRVGGGSRKGFGEIKIVTIQNVQLDLSKPDDLDSYLDKSSNLEESATWNRWEEYKHSMLDDNNWNKYELTLKADDFFLFGAVAGDNEADTISVKENVVIWNDSYPKITENNILIPATSFKGAISHRVAYHYNKLKQRYADDHETNDNIVGRNNEAVIALFGAEGGVDEQQIRGNVIFSDIIEENNCGEKILNHVAIDRFTAGAIPGALFSEKPIYGDDKIFSTNILIPSNLDSDFVTVFEQTLKDICTGLLPLGGGVNRGNGRFAGQIVKNNVVIFPKNN